MMSTIELTNGVQRIENDTARYATDWSHKSLPQKISNLKFQGNLLMRCNSTNGKRLVFTGCEFDIINIKDFGEISELVLEQCKIETLHIYESNITLKLENCVVKEIITQQCQIPKIAVEDTNIEEISLESNGTVKEILISGGSKVNKIDGKDAGIGKLRIHSSLVGWVHINASIEKMELSDGALLERFSINDKEELIRFLKTLKSRKGSISEREILARQHKQILLAAFTQYDEEHKYQELDFCLLKLRRVNNYLNRLNTKNPFRKLGYVCQELVLGKMFGWGISVHNSILTSTMIILLFSFLYCFIMREKFDSGWSCMIWCLVESINRFFGVDSAEAQVIIPNFDSAEQILGVIILTIFTGVLARKIIR